MPNGNGTAMPKETKPKRPPRTVKEKKFVQAYIENGGNATQAALKVYDTSSYNSAHVIASENLRKLTFDHYFQAAGLTDEMIARLITSKVFNAKKRDLFTGEESDDHAEQRKNLELAIKVMGKFAAPRAPVDQEGNTVVPILMALDVYGDGSD